MGFLDSMSLLKLYVIGNNSRYGRIIHMHFSSSISDRTTPHSYVRLPMSKRTLLVFTHLLNVFKCLLNASQLVTGAHLMDSQPLVVGWDPSSLRLQSYVSTLVILLLDLRPASWNIN